MRAFNVLAGVSLVLGLLGACGSDLDGFEGGMGTVASSLDHRDDPGNGGAPPGRSCEPGVLVELSGRPHEMEGHYVEAFDCGEFGGSFGGVDFACFGKDDGSSWRITNRGCGWEIGRMVPSADSCDVGWDRHALTYAGYCAEILPEQLDIRGLTTSTLYDSFGEPISRLSSSYCEAVIELPVVVVEYTGSQLPAEIAGTYVEAFDCELEEGGAWFGGVDFAHCFRKRGGSSWRIWNSGCGWQIGRVVASTQFRECTTEWVRYAATYASYCSEIPPEQLDVRALTTSTFYDNFGNPIPDISSSYLEP